ncbi:YcxB family protein [Sphingosinicella sp. LHD-64]|uniref:YcxB family protein n=1 Tax=Sphingosinicella sp. LHD-64 TaxID=3072139 RepID=UPI00280CFC23|nr:YcxB family protein [Sphingosinicella sp. LHD-64]MDQ8755869.1 YcxB family protein [Sphingosinicella sp. LHD-64]
MGQTTFRYTEADLIAANHAFQRTQLRSRKALFFATFMIIWCAGTGAVMAMLDRKTIWPSALGGFVIGLAVLALILLGNRLYAVRYARRNFAQQRNLADEYRIAWDDQGFESVAERGSFRQDWAEFHRWLEDDRLFMLFLSERLYIGIPKRALPPDQLISLRGHLERAGPPKL